jgi:hypothetical protein
MRSMPSMRFGERGGAISRGEGGVGQNAGVRRKRIVHGDHRGLGGNLDICETHGAARLLTGSGGNGEHHLAVKFHTAVRKHRVVSHDRAHVVAAGISAAGQHRDDAGRRSHSIEVDAGDDAARGRRAAGCDVERSCGFPQIIHIEGAAADMADRRVVPGRHADDAQRGLIRAGIGGHRSFASLTGFTL